MKFHLKQGKCHVLFQKVLLSKCTSLLMLWKSTQTDWLRFSKTIKNSALMKGLMKLNLFQEILLFSIFLHNEVK